MIQPATDEEIEVIARLYDAPVYSSLDREFQSLIARIRAEQASQATAREQAIRECAEVALQYGGISAFSIRLRLLDLLSSTGEETK